MNSREDDIFITPTRDSGGLPSLGKSYSIFKATQPGIYHHIIGLGGWSTNNPWQNEVYSSWGIDYPLRQITDENVYICSSYRTIARLQQYVLEHSFEETTASLVNIEYGTTIYKVTKKNMNVITHADIGNLKLIKYEYNSEYNTYDISAEIIIKDTSLISDEQVNRIFVTLTDEQNQTGYYMVCGGNDMRFEREYNEIVAMIPADMLELGTEYKVNIMFQNSKGDNTISTDSGMIYIRE